MKTDIKPSLSDSVQALIPGYVSGKKRTKIKVLVMVHPWNSSGRLLDQVLGWGIRSMVEERVGRHHGPLGLEHGSFRYLMIQVHNSLSLQMGLVRWSL
jgi:hypothetical protein